MGRKFCVDLGREAPKFLVPRILYIFTYFTRYLKAHFQTQLNALQRQYPLTTPSSKGSNDVRMYPWRSGEYCGDG